jgi:hypothetical protein
MTVAMILFVLVILMGVGLARQLLASRSATSKLADSESFSRATAHLDRYHVMGRLFAQSDLAFVHAHACYGPQTLGRLRRQRRRICRLYLREIRADFARIWSLCRLLTPYVKDPEFSTALLRELVTFYTLYSLLWLGTLRDSTAHNLLDVDAIVGALTRLREAAQQALLSAERLAYSNSSAGA